MSTFNCYYCKEDLDIEYIAKGTLTKGTGRGKCRPCKSLATQDWAERKKVKLFPNLYMGCNNCDTVFKKKITKKFLKFAAPDTRTHCPTCMSTNIEDY